jgi:hypothetical protein
MSDQTMDAIALARAEEQLRQERETFDENRRQGRRWFVLRLIVGYTSVLALISIMATCLYVLMNNASFPSSVVVTASATLFGDVLGLVITIWKVVINPGAAPTLTPVTTTSTLPSARRRSTAGG